MTAVYALAATCWTMGVDISRWAYFEMVKMEGMPWLRTDGWIVFGMLFGR